MKIRKLPELRQELIQKKISSLFKDNPTEEFSMEFVSYFISNVYKKIYNHVSLDSDIRQSVWSLIDLGEIYFTENRKFKSMKHSIWNITKKSD